MSYSISHTTGLGGFVTFILEDEFNIHHKLQCSIRLEVLEHCTLEELVDYVVNVFGKYNLEKRGIKYGGGKV